MTVTTQDCPNCRILFPEARQRIKEALGAKDVRAEFDISYLANMIGAWYDDDTYSAIRLQVRRDREVPDTEWLIMALRKAPRRPIKPAECIVFENY